MDSFGNLYPKLYVHSFYLACPLWVYSNWTREHDDHCSDNNLRSNNKGQVTYITLSSDN